MNKNRGTGIGRETTQVGKGSLGVLDRYHDMCLVDYVLGDGMEGEMVDVHSYRPQWAGWDDFIQRHSLAVMITFRLTLPLGPDTS